MGSPSPSASRTSSAARSRAPACLAKAPRFRYGCRGSDRARDALPDASHVKLEVYADAGAAARAAAGIIAVEARSAAAARGRFVMAVSGGRTSWLMLRALAAEDDGGPQLRRSRAEAERDALGGAASIDGSAKASWSRRAARDPAWRLPSPSRSRAATRSASPSAARRRSLRSCLPATRVGGTAGARAAPTLVPGHSCSGRLRGALRPGGEALGRHLGPFLHHVLGVAPLPLRRRLDGAAADALVHARRQELATGRVGELELRLCAAHERIGPGRATLDRAQQPRLRKHHGHGPQTRRGRGDVGQRHLELHDVRAVLVDDLELLGQLLVEGGVEKVHEPLLILGGDLGLLVAPERHRLDHDLAVLGPLRRRVDVAQGDLPLGAGTELSARGPEEAAFEVRRRHRRLLRRATRGQKHCGCADGHAALVHNLLPSCSVLVTVAGYKTRVIASYLCRTARRTRRLDLGPRSRPRPSARSRELELDLAADDVLGASTRTLHEVIRSDLHADRARAELEDLAGIEADRDRPRVTRARQPAPGDDGVGLHVPPLGEGVADEDLERRLLHGRVDRVIKSQSEVSENGITA